MPIGSGIVSAEKGPRLRIDPVQIEIRKSGSGCDNTVCKALLAERFKYDINDVGV
jgi:hypothetical protein